MIRASSRTSGATRRSLIVIVLLISLSTASCNRTESEDPSDLGVGFPVKDSGDCLPRKVLLDQHGSKILLADLKGKPALVNFIYTSCPGECLILTQHMKRIANALGPELGDRVRLISITVDPEHDQPTQLQQYASSQGADLRGWLFLTGTPDEIDAEMARFNLIRTHEADGSIDHVSEMFLVAPDGRALMQYVGDKISAEHAIADLNAAAAGKSISVGESSIVPVKY